MSMVVPPGSTPWRLDPEDPRAPSMEAWEAMTPEERARVVASLPAEPAPLQGMGGETCTTTSPRGRKRHVRGIDPAPGAVYEPRARDGARRRTVRFYAQGPPLPFQQEFIGKLEQAVDVQLSRVLELEGALETERLFAEAKSEIERLRAG